MVEPSDVLYNNTDIKLTKEQESHLSVGIEYNLRGLNTYNLFKRVIWQCVTTRNDKGELTDNSLVNLKLLKGFLNEI
jgi:hypothetical protein